MKIESNVISSRTSFENKNFLTRNIEYFALILDGTIKVKT